MRTAQALTMLAALAALAAVSPAVAEVDPGTLHNLAKQALIQAQIQSGPSDPPIVQDLLDEGERHVNAILNATDSEDAGEHFLAAMRMFSEAFDIMNQDSPDNENGSPYYDAMLDRAAKYYGHLLELADAYGVETHGEDMDALFELAAFQIAQGDPEVADTLMEINNGLGLLRERIGVVAAEEDRERALKYAALYVKHLERLVADAEELNIPPDGVGMMLAIRDRLVNATEPSEIIEIINEIIDIKQEMDLAKANQLELWMQQTRDTAERMHQEGDLDDIEYAAVQATLGRFLEEMERGDLDEAGTILDRLNEWLLDR